MKRRSFLKGLAVAAAVPFAPKAPAKWEPVLDSTPKLHAGPVDSKGWQVGWDNSEEDTFHIDDVCPKTPLHVAGGEER